MSYKKVDMCHLNLLSPILIKVLQRTFNYWIIRPGDHTFNQFSLKKGNIVTYSY